MPPPKLKEQAEKFDRYLCEIKQKTKLHVTSQWYPWSSLGQFNILDDFLKGDPGALLKMIEPDPALDVGCGDGDISFFLESLGVRVDAVDHLPANYNALLGVQRMKEILHSPVNFQTTDLDTHPVFPSENYGFAVMLGVLYHLKNPFLALEALARRARYAFLSTRIAQLGPDRKTNYGGFPVAYLVGDDELNDDYTNFWIFTEVAFQRVVRRSGWDIVHYSAFGPVANSDPVTPEGDARAFILAKSRLAIVPRLLDGWHQLEGAIRWTQRRFAFELDVDLALENAPLRFAFHLPKPVLAVHPRVMLHARVAGRELPAAIYEKTGDHEYKANVGSLFTGPVRVEFELDRSIGPTSEDLRELGVQVSFAGAPAVTLG